MNIERPEWEHFIRIAKVKLKSLMEREDFLRVVETGGDYTILEFQNKVCKVSSFGRVTW